MNLNQTDNLVIQSYLTTSFLLELKKANFLKSDYYDKLTFINDFTKKHLTIIGIDNQGALLMSLYALLVIPKQLLSQKFPSEFVSLNNIVNKIKSKSESNYKSDSLSINYVRHIRNSVAHANVTFIDNESVTFTDENAKEKCTITIPLVKVGNLINALENIFITYISTLK